LRQESCPHCPSLVTTRERKLGKERLWKGASSLFLPGSSLRSPRSFGAGGCRLPQGNHPCELLRFPPWFPGRHIRCYRRLTTSQKYAAFFLKVFSESRSTPPRSHAGSFPRQDAPGRILGS